MRLLVDSHVALWWLEDNPNLGPKCRQLIQEADEAYFSVVTPWELGIKRALGKIAIPDDISDTLSASGFLPLAISVAHAEAAPVLPAHHRDPFDRMLVAQAQLEALTLVTADTDLDSYEVARIDARR